MKWIKHDTNANRDTKLKKVRLKYGLEGYGLYWYLIELIGADIDEHNLTFQLEDDAEIISHETGIHVERINEMMAFMVKLGLFENVGGIITCMKLLSRLDQSMTSNANMRKLIQKAKDSHDGIMIKSDKVMQEESRVEKKENRIEEKESNQAWPEFITKSEISEIKELKRKATKQKLTDRAQKLLCKELEVLHNAGYTMEQVLNTWAEFPHWKTFKADYLIGKQAPAGQAKRIVEKREQLATEKTPEQKAMASQILGALRT